jgi:hypothetical protein
VVFVIEILFFTAHGAEVNDLWFFVNEVASAVLGATGFQN